MPTTALGQTVYETFLVNIPYVVDSSPWRDVINANFSPEITQLAAGDVIAVKIANTNYGPTTIYVSSLPGIQLLPNGGGMMLQGDLHAGDIALLLFDGQHFHFTPNPEINSWVMYTVGDGQQFTSVEECLDAIRRKTIGANGFVHVQISQQILYAPAGKYAVIEIDHPSADRIAIVGTMIGTNPEWWEFRATGADANTHALDAVYNANMLRTRYGTVLQLPWRGEPNSCAGILQAGPGKPAIHDILILGNRPDAWAQGWGETGVQAWDGSSIKCFNVAVWGAHMGFRADAARLTGSFCWAMACTHNGWSTGEHASMSLDNSGSFGNGADGLATHHGSFSSTYLSYTLCNAGDGLSVHGGSISDTWHHTSLGNGVLDYFAAYNSTINSNWTRSVGTVSPAWNTVGNFNGLIALHTPIEFAPPPR